MAGERPPQAPQVIPSRPSELAQGHGSQSLAVLVGLATVSFAGLVISVLNKLAGDD